MSEPVLSLRGVSRTYRTGEGELEVLRGVDLDVFAGEVIGLIGPSGSGKSSLLHAAGLLEHPTQGRVLVAGQDCTALADRARTRVRLGLIGFVYQFHHLLAEFSALDNVALAQMIAGQTKAAARRRAAALLTHLGLAERLNHQPGQLSGGEQQRVAIARALANEPRRGAGRRAHRQPRPAHLRGGVPGPVRTGPDHRASPWSSPPTTWSWPATWTGCSRSRTGAWSCRRASPRLLRHCKSV